MVARDLVKWHAANRFFKITDRFEVGIALYPLLIAAKGLASIEAL